MMIIIGDYYYYRCDNNIQLKSSEDRGHVDDGKWFSDDKIILRTMTVILPVNKGFSE